MTIEETWQQIERWLSGHCPEVLGGLNPPATEAQLLACEQAIGRALPAELRASYKVHDGMNRRWFFDMWYLVPVDELIPSSPRPQQRLYVTENGCGDGIVLLQEPADPDDCGFDDKFVPSANPAEILPAGTICEFLHDDTPSLRPVAASFGGFLARVLTAMEAGRLQPDAEGQLWSEGGLFKQA